MKAPPDSEHEALAKTVARLMHAHAEHARSFAAAPGKTIDPARAPELMQTLSARGKHSSTPKGESAVRSGVELGEVLGQGGMGVVRRGTQLALQRDVAVKTIQPKLACDAATRMLLQEALILGRLEHPNILPVYDIRSESGEPRIVLKKIEGIEWSALMHRPELLREELDASDPLEWNIGILMTVCNAVHFAHSRGFIHRDLKPDNVMIGEFGEVYVMDWGLAVQLEDDGSGRFPQARDAKQLAGTPQYMAPEMLGDGGEVHLSARTDVYLLGAILYEIIAGHPPHRGKDMREMLGQVVVSRPSIPESCPSELARICRMAMDPDPGWRFESAEALRNALAGFLRHAGSRRLADQAKRATDQLLELIHARKPEYSKEQRVQIQNLFGECRFAYRQALESWQENDVARAGLERAVRAMIDYELGQSNPRSAANLIVTLREPDAELRARVDEAVAQLEASERRMAHLESFQKQLDVKTGSRNRAIGAGLLGSIWSIAPLGAPVIVSEFPQLGRLPALAFVSAVIVGIGIWAWLARSEIAQSRITRQLMRAAAVAMLGQLALEAAAIVLGVPPALTEVLWPLVWFSVSAMLVITVDARLLPMTLGFLATLLIGAFWPEWRFYAMSGSNLIMTFNMFSIWMPLRREAEAAVAEARAPDAQ